MCGSFVCALRKRPREERREKEKEKEKVARPKWAELSEIPEPAGRDQAEF